MYVDEYVDALLHPIHLSAFVADQRRLGGRHRRVAVDEPDGFSGACGSNKSKGSITASDANDTLLVAAVCTSADSAPIVFSAA